jgi:chitinase
MKSPSSMTPKNVLIGYVGGFRGLVNTNLIQAEKLTHINYAFVDVRYNRAWLTNEVTDTVNFRKLNLLKQKNPDLKILISIGGWSWSENFSDAVLTDTSRIAFAKSAIDIVRKYDLDGIDIDWEYPAKPGEEGNIYRPEDKQNFTLMFQEISKQLKAVEEETGKKILLTTAVGAGSSFISHTEMAKVQQYVDYINLMTYDNGSDSLARHHTNLYPSGKFADEKSVERTVREFMAAGVPAHKLVVGIAFYAHIYNMATSKGKGFAQKVASRARVQKTGYTFIKDSLVNKNGYKKYWDKKAKAPYLFNKVNSQFVTYDDKKSVTAKCKFVQSHKLAGVMFWEYSSDPKGYLLNAIHQAFE